MALHRDRRNFLKMATMGTGAFYLNSLLNGATTTKKRKRPNILWIMTDQQPIRGVGCYGKSICKTPNIDSIASKGMRFDQFHVAAFPCCPSRASMFTGRYAHNHGIFTNEIPLAENIPSLGNILKTNGYTTGYVGKWHLGGEMYRNLPDGTPHSESYNGNWYLKRVSDKDNYKYEKVNGGTGEDKPNCGWDYWVGGWKHYKEYIRSVGLGKLADKDPFLGAHMIGACKPRHDAGIHMHSTLPEEHHLSTFLADESVKFLRAQKGSDNPFALTLSFYGPHNPVAPPEPWDQMYGIEDVSLPDNFSDPMENKPRIQFNPKKYKAGTWTDDQFRDYIRRYWGYCSYIDKQIGKTLRALQEIGEYDNTIILFISDHGDMVASHKNIHKNIGNGYDELMRVPFLIQYPDRIKPDTTSEALVSTIDILPTLLDMLKLEKPKDIDGKSFISILTGNNSKHRKIVFTSSLWHNFVATSKQYKFNLNYGPLEKQVNELYDRFEDPGEIHNLIASPLHKDVAKKMANQIFEWLKKTGHPYIETARRGFHEAC